MLKKKELSKNQTSEILLTLRERFNKNMSRHKGIDWQKIQLKLESNSGKLWSINAMEETGGEPDVIGFDKSSDQYIFCDCSIESPSGRRSLCYDNEALESRKANKPKSSAMTMAQEMGIELMNEDQYKELEKLGKFDNKTSSWLLTPPEIRNVGGAIFGDLRFGRIFIYHNGAESYYAGRGFRGILKL